MADLPKISDEEMDELVKLFRAGHAVPPVPSTPDERIRAGLAVALVGSGYRPEADVLREAADGLLECHYELSRVTVATFADWLRQRATALDPAQPLPVADGSEADSLETERG